MQMPLSSNQRFWIRYFSTVLDTSRYIFCPVHHVGLPFPHWKNFEAWSHSSKIVTFWKIPRTKNYTFLIIKIKTKKKQNCYTRNEACFNWLKSFLEEYSQWGLLAQLTKFELVRDSLMLQTRISPIQNHQHELQYLRQEVYCLVLGPKWANAPFPKKSSILSISQTN